MTADLTQNGEPLGLKAALVVAGAHRGAVARRAVLVSAKLAPVLVRGVGHAIVSCGPRRAQATASKLREALEALGPAFVKLGQALASREDILSEEVAQELRKLCDAVPEFPREVAQSLVDEELGHAAPRVPDRAMAAASLGQVYRIQLDGKDYALKVQRPGLRWVLAVDVVILKGMAKMTRRFVRTFCAATMDPVHVVECWAETLWGELDYRREAEVMENMRAKLCPVVENLVIPRACWRLTSSRVLGTEWVQGIKVTDIPKSVKTKHIAVGVETYAAMIIDLGVVHADPHAGNLLITTPDDKVCLLDFGMVIQVPPSHRRVWASCIVELVRGNYAGVLECLVGLGFFPADCPREEILPVMSKIWSEMVACGSNTRKRKEAVTTCYKEIKVLVRKFTFDIPDYYLALVRALLTLEGIALTADCEFDIFEAAFPVALRAVTSSEAAAGVAAVARALVPAVMGKMSCRRRNDAGDSSEGTGTRALTSLATAATSAAARRAARSGRGSLAAAAAVAAAVSTLAAGPLAGGVVAGMGVAAAASRSELRSPR